jgi:hypothetical protein
LKAGFCPALASAGPVCPGSALLLAHGLTARPLPPACGLGDGAKPPENRQNSPVVAFHQLWQDGAGMNESEKQFSFTRAAPSTSGRAKNQIPISSASALDPTHQLVNLKYVFRDPFILRSPDQAFLVSIRTNRIMPRNDSMKISPEELLKEIYGLLAQILEEAFAECKQDELRQAFVYRHGLTILRLAEDALHLEAERRCYSSPIIVRCMLECLFNLVAAAKQPHFAREKVCWEVENEITRIGKWIAGPADMQDTVKRLQSLAQSLRKQNHIPANLNWNTLACADTAGLGQQYRREYFLFSKNVHATTSGMISSEKDLCRGHVLQTIAFVVVCASGHIVQLLPTKNPQGHVDRAAELMENLTSAVRAGGFQGLDDSLSKSLLSL